MVGNVGLIQVGDEGVALDQLQARRISPNLEIWHGPGRQLDQDGCLTKIRRLLTNQVVIKHKRRDIATLKHFQNQGTVFSETPCIHFHGIDLLGRRRVSTKAGNR